MHKAMSIVIDGTLYTSQASRASEMILHSRSMVAQLGSGWCRTYGEWTLHYMHFAENINTLPDDKCSSKLNVHASTFSVCEVPHDTYGTFALSLALKNRC